MMLTPYPCKRCLIEEQLKIKQSISELVSLIPDHKKIPQNLYMERLSLCESCGDNIEGTCVKCGCYVELRAAKLHMSCPSLLWKKLSL